MGVSDAGYLSMPKGMAAYIGGLGTFGATLAGWAISSHILWIAVVAAAVAALLGGLAFCVGFETSQRMKHGAMAASVLMAVLAGFLVFRTVSVSEVNATTVTSKSAHSTEVNNKAESDGDEAPAIAGGSGNSVSYGNAGPEKAASGVKATKGRRP